MLKSIITHKGVQFEQTLFQVGKVYVTIDHNDFFFIVLHKEAKIVASLPLSPTPRAYFAGSEIDLNQLCTYHTPVRAYVVIGADNATVFRYERAVGVVYTCSFGCSLLDNAHEPTIEELDIFNSCLHLMETKFRKEVLAPRKLLEQRCEKAMLTHMQEQLASILGVINVTSEVATDEHFSRLDVIYKKVDRPKGDYFPIYLSKMSSGEYKWGMGAYRRFSSSELIAAVYDLIHGKQGNQSQFVLDPSPTVHYANALKSLDA